MQLSSGISKFCQLNLRSIYEYDDQKAKSFSLSAYIEKALKLAEYEKGEDGVVVASVPNISGFFSQGENLEEARDNLRDAIEGNLLVALQLGFAIPEIVDVEWQ